MVLASWAELTAEASEEALALLTAYRSACLALPEVTEEVHRTEVTYRRTRVFTAGFPLARRLEIVVDLIEPVAHPLVIATFAPNKQLVAHRLTIRTPDELDSVLPLVQRAHAEVGPLPRRLPPGFVR